MTFRAWALCLCLVLAGCAGVVKIEGEQVLNQRLSVTVSSAWNKVTFGATNQPYEAWTQEGLMLDHLRLWSGIQPGQALMVLPSASGSGGQKPMVPATFRSAMALHELVALFEQLYAADGSIVEIGQTGPSQFAGEPGVRFEFTVLRKSDGVALKGVGWAATRGNALFAATFVAPRLYFFDQLLPKAQAVVATARIR